MNASEPYRLFRHHLKGFLINSSFFTCARPGRSLGTKQAAVSDEVVHSWIEGIKKELQFTVAGSPYSKDEIAIVSLLGRKPNGLSEFSYYSFRGGFDQAEDRPGCPRWQEWLNGYYGSQFRVYEFPTEDLKPIDEETKKNVVSAILALVESGNSVVLVDSGGVGRTGRIVHALQSSQIM